MMNSRITVVILAAGVGRRLEPLSLRHSKAMTPILGVPILARVIQGFQRLGITDFVIVKGPEDTELERLCDGFCHEGLRIRTAIQAERKGTAHALIQARELIDQDFVLCSCDNLYSDEFLQNLVHEHLTHHPSAVLTLTPVSEGNLQKSAGVRLSGAEVLEIKEKPGQDGHQWDAIAKFLFTFNRRILDYLDKVKPSPRGELEVQEALALMMNDFSIRPRGLFVDFHFHLTNIADLLSIHQHYLEKHRPFVIHRDARIHPHVIMHQPVMIDQGAEICSHTTLGPNVYVGPDALIGEASYIENAVIYPRARINPGTRLAAQVILCD